jgi:hypothetical protein
MINCRLDGLEQMSRNISAHCLGVNHQQVNFAARCFLPSRFGGWIENRGGNNGGDGGNYTSLPEF